MTSGKKPYRILAIDGGGVRGLIPAIWLSKIEQELGKPLNNYFDLVVGTSTGSLLACAVATGTPMKEAAQIYIDRAAQVFPQSDGRFWQNAKRFVTQRFAGPQYGAEGLQTTLKDVLGDRNFGECKIPTMVTTYNLLNRKALMLKSWRTDHAALPMWEVCAASSSAPTFFPAHVMRVGVADLPLVDGGVVAASPAASALTEAIRLDRDNGEPRSLDDYVMVSLGTGVSTRHISIEEGLSWGPWDWAIPLFDIVFDGNRQAVNYMCRNLLTPDNYIRLQVRLDAASSDMDNSDPTNINALAAVAQNYMVQDGGKQTIARVVEKLESCLSEKTSQVRELRPSDPFTGQAH